jgi:hypothetical protein
VPLLSLVLSLVVDVVSSVVEELVSGTAVLSDPVSVVSGPSELASVVPEDEVVDDVLGATVVLVIVLDPVVSDVLSASPPGSLGSVPHAVIAASESKKILSESVIASPPHGSFSHDGSVRVLGQASPSHAVTDLASDRSLVIESGDDLLVFAIELGVSDRGIGAPEWYVLAGKLTRKRGWWCAWSRSPASRPTRSPR